MKCHVLSMSAALLVVGCVAALLCCSCLDPNNSSADDALTASNKVVNSVISAQKLAATGRTNEALSLLNEVMEQFPIWPDPYVSKSMVLLQMKRPQEALAAARHAASLDPQFSWAHFYEGLALWEMNELSDALDSLDTAISLDPNFAYAYLNRGLLWLRLAWPDKAAMDLEEFVKRETNAEMLNELAWLYLSEETAWNPSRALTLALEAVRIDRRPEYLDTLACAYAEKDMFDMALLLELEAMSMTNDPTYAQMTNLFHGRVTYLRWKAGNAATNTGRATELKGEGTEHLRK